MTIRKPVVPRKARQRAGLKPGDTLRYCMTEEGVLLDKAPANEADDPFATFSEWSNEADENSLEPRHRSAARQEGAENGDGAAAAGAFPRSGRSLLLPPVKTTPSRRLAERVAA